jgi:hypothetical protein
MDRRELLFLTISFNQFRERLSAGILQDGFKFRISAPVRQKIVTVGFPERTDESIPFLAVNFTVFVPVTLVEAWLFHGGILAER